MVSPPILKARLEREARLLRLIPNLPATLLYEFQPMPKQVLLALKAAYLLLFHKQGYQQQPYHRDRMCGGLCSPGEQYIRIMIP